MNNLDQTMKYKITGHNYIPLSEGCGCACDNCGAMLANIVYITDGKNKFTVGPDCASKLSGISKPELSEAEKGLKDAVNFYSKIEKFKKLGGIEGVHFIIEDTALFQLKGSFKIKVAEY